MPCHSLLFSEQLFRLFGIPTEWAEIERHYAMDVTDLALVCAR